MNENYDDEVEINTDSNKDKNENFNLNSNTYVTNINEKSIIGDDKLFLNGEYTLPNTNTTNYIQSSFPLSSSLNQINENNEINDFCDLNNMSIRIREKSIIDNLNEKIENKLNTNIQYMSILALGTVKDNSLSKDCDLGLSIISSGLLSQFMKIDANMVLFPLLNIRKSCFRQLSVEQIMTWQKSELKDPLLKMENEIDKEISLQLFRNLLSYMKDRNSRKGPIFHASKFVKLVKSGNPIIKDEAYLQVYKQLHNNNKRESLMRAWKFLAIISCCFVPNNENIYHLILNFLFFELQNTNDQIIKKHINYIFVHMVQTEKHERKNTPCYEELQYIEYLRPIPIPIYFFNGKQAIINIEPYTTFRELKTEIMNILDFSTQRAIFYSIYEICYNKTGTEERFIDDNEIVGDVLTLWKSDIEKSKLKKELIIFRFYLKLLIYYQFDETNADNISILYYQTLYDVISGKYQLSESQILALAALELVNEFESDIENAYNSLKESYENYIPGNYTSLMTKDQWIEKIIELYSNFSSFPKNDCKMEYLKLLETHSLFKIHQFESKFDYEKSSDNDDLIPENCILGFQPDGILILDSKREKVVFYEYITIKNWGISDKVFVIILTLDNIKLRKLYFYTGQTNVIQTIMEIYACIIAGKSLNEMKTIIEERNKKFNTNISTKRNATKFTRDSEYDFSYKTNNLSERSSFVFPILPNDSNDDDKNTIN